MKTITYLKLTLLISTVVLQVSSAPAADIKIKRKENRLGAQVFAESSIARPECKYGWWQSLVHGKVRPQWSFQCTLARGRAALF